MTKVNKKFIIANGTNVLSPSNTKEQQLTAAKESIRKYLKQVNQISNQGDLKDPLYHFFDFAGDESFWIYKNVCLLLLKFLSVPENSTFLRNGIGETIYPDLIDMIHRLHEFTADIEKDHFVAQITLYGLEQYPILAQDLPGTKKIYDALSKGIPL